MRFKDYYETLGVARGASQEDVKRAYRRLARKYHPDVSKEGDAESRFKEIGEAYEVLKDPEKRAAYDRFGKDWKHGQEFRRLRAGSGSSTSAAGPPAPPASATSSRRCSGKTAAPAAFTARAGRRGPGAGIRVRRSRSRSRTPTTARPAPSPSTTAGS